MKNQIGSLLGIATIILFATPVLADDICVAGDQVRLRSAPSVNSAIVKEYYWADYLGDAGSAVSASDIQTIGGKEGRWMKINRKVCSTFSCTNESGNIFSPYIKSCDQVNFDKQQFLQNSAIPLENRLAMRTLMIGSDYQFPGNPSPLARLLPGGGSNRAGILCEYGCVGTFRWQVSGNRLIVDVDTQDPDPAGSGKQIQFRCEYNVKKSDTLGLELVPTGRNKKYCTNAFIN